MSPLIIMLLASVGPMLVGFDLIDEFDDDEDPDAVPDPDVGGDPVATVDVAEFVLAARTTTGDVGPFNAVRGTDAVQDFVGLDDASNIFDTSGGDDTIQGGMLDDTLIGGEDSDQIAGGDGDDAIFGGFQRASRVDDIDADTLDGGAGDDTLFLGDDDIASGGTGADVFVTVQDTAGNTTITDFTPGEDSLVVETVTPEETTVERQTLSEDGLLITLSNGATITLSGLEAEIDPDGIVFLNVTPLETNIWI